VADKEGKKKSSDGFRVAQVDQGTSADSSSVEKKKEKASEKKPEQLEEVIVTGSRIPLLAGQQQVQPVHSYTRDDIASSGQSTMGEFLSTLPGYQRFTTRQRRPDWQARKACSSTDCRSGLH